MIFTDMNMFLHRIYSGGSHLPVTFDNCQHYAQLLEDYRLNEYNRQIAALCRGLASIVPFEFLSIFTWQQLEVLVTGMYGSHVIRIYDDEDDISCSHVSCIMIHRCLIVSTHHMSTLSSSHFHLGNPDIDISLLRDKTEYRGNVSSRDRHIQLFWEVLEGFTLEERKLFLQFVRLYVHVHVLFGQVVSYARCS